MQANDPNDALKRKAQRRSLPIRIYSLGQEPSDDLSSVTTPEQRIAMMWPLTIQAWTLARRPFPEYSRDATPLRVIRPKVNAGKKVRR